MAPHSMNDAHANGISRRAKPNRVAPAIPYALVKPKSKTTSAAPATPNPADASSLAAESSVPSPSTLAQLAPLTPASLASSQERAVSSSATATDSISDRVLDSEGSKPSNTPHITSSLSSPSTKAAPSPKITSSSPKQQAHDSSVPSSFTQQPAHSVQIDQPVNRTGALQPGPVDSAVPPLANHTNGSQNGVSRQFRAGIDANRVPHFSSDSQQMHLNTNIVMPPPGMIPAPYNADFMSPPITSPISGWNPNANFIPPSHQIHAQRRSMHDSMSPRAASHKSTTSDAHAPKPLAPMSFTQPLPPIDMFPWSSYINIFYSNSRFADFSLVPGQSGSSRGASEFPAHGIIISKSSVLSQLIQGLPSQPKRNESGQIYLILSFDEKLTSFRSVLEAIGHLYGQPLPHYGEGLPLSVPADVIMDRMTSALSLAGAGQFLGLPEVMSHGLAFAIDFVGWQTFEKALGFAQASMNALTAFREADNRSNELIKVMCHHHSNLMFRLERFLIDNFPKKFVFSSSASELAEAGRLPVSVETRPSVSHARLASIQFGEMPSLDPTIVQSDSLLSSILLSVPTAILGRFLESPELVKRFGRSALIALLGDVIDERERRRFKAVKNRSTVPEVNNTQQEELRWKELLEQHPQSPMGIIVTKVPAEQDQ